jgi:hypothetical protein
VKEQDISDKNTKQLVEKLQIQSLPALLFKSDVNSYKHFQQDLNAGMFIKRDDNYYQVSDYILNTKFFWSRPKIKDSMKIFIMSQCPFGISLANQIAKLIKEKKITYNIDFHYVFNKDASGVIGSLHGMPELDEDKRQLVIKEYYPGQFIDYMLCRNQDINNLNWQECAKKFSIDVDSVTNKVNAESESMVNDEFKLAEELGINSSPVVLWENYYKITEVNELKKIKGFETLEKLTGSCGK